jgi:signal transduction histidine kinase
MARARINNAWLRLVTGGLVALIATALLGNAWALYWYAGLFILLLGDRAFWRWMLARCEAGMAPRRLTWPTAWIAVQSAYGSALAALLWFSPFVPGETLAVIFICGVLANVAATLRASFSLSLAGAGPAIAFLLGLPIADYALSGWSDPLLLTPLVGGLLLLGFGVNLWRSMLDSDAAHARAEAAAMRERQAAAAAAAAKSQTIKRMNDELRTPMQALIGAAEHLRRAAATPEARAHIATLVQAGEVLKLALDDLSDLDQLENGLVRVTPRPADPRDIARSVVSAFRAAAHDKHLELFLDVTRAAPALVHIDAPRVRQILFNLVANAVRFTSHGGVRVTLSAQAGAGAGHVRLTYAVTDTGAGMSRARLAQIFARERVGAGGEAPELGLAISLRLARLMGGQISAKSELGHGSVFSFTLEAPIAAARNAA